MSEIAAPNPHNIPEITVSELAGAVKRALESSFSRVRVRGEITEMKTYPSGHTYMALKDDGAKIRAIIWKGNASRLGLKPENGVEVIATGKITAYSERSEYQLIIERLDYAGEGAMLARIEALRLKLADEGLFEHARKRPLPFLPRVIGVVSSPQGAVIQDIRTTIARRFPSRIILWPVAVQGEGAAMQIAAAIAGFSGLPADGPIPRPDVVIVARGGGSLEDLMAFNDEAVVRAAASSQIPLISAVGHETDTTLIDFAADRRAPTPTAAAELAVPDRLGVSASLAQLGARLTGALAGQINARHLRLNRAAGQLPDLPSLMATARQRLDERSERFAMALPRYAQAKRHRLEQIVARLPDPRHLLTGKTHGLALVVQRLAPPMRTALRERSIKLDALAARLNALSYQAVLMRGFALVTAPDGAPISEAATARSTPHMIVRFQDGTVSVQPEKSG
ncbi:MAG: exodeoxyribonuclease VII large subunit [Acidiphilium sp.]